MKLEKSSLITLVSIVLIVVAGAYYVWFSNTATERKFSELPADNFNQAARTLQLTDLDGNPVALVDYRGSVLVVNAWASWCPFCVQELPDFQKLAAEYGNKNVVVLAINRAESKPQIEAYLSTIATLDNVVVLQDTNDSYYSFIGGFSMPETIFYDREGNVVVHKRGFMNFEEMKTHVEAALSLQ